MTENPLNRVRQREVLLLFPQVKNPFLKLALNLGDTHSVSLKPKVSVHFFFLGILLPRNGNFNSLEERQDSELSPGRKGSRFGSRRRHSRIRYWSSRNKIQGTELLSVMRAGHEAHT
jgi:hypothetical protein